MIVLLDIEGSGLFPNSSQFVHGLGEALKLIGGSILVIVLALVLLVGVIGRSVYKGFRQSSLMLGLSLLLRSVAYVIGLTVALLFVLVAKILFGLSLLKTLVIAALLVFIIAWIARETFMFIALKRFGKHIFYLTTLHRAGKEAYKYVKTKSDDTGESPIEKNS